MGLSLLLAEEIAAMFLAMVVGYAVVKTNLFTSEDSKIISRMVVYICSPCIIVNAFQIEMSSDKVQGLGLAFGASVFVHFFMILLMKGLSRPFHLLDIERASVIYTNAANLTIPLVASVLGDEWIFYTSAYMIVHTVLFWTHGTGLIIRGGKRDYRKILLNPNMIAIGVGILLFCTGISFPVVVNTAITGFGDMIGPVSMLVIGMVIGEIDLREVFAPGRAYFICLIRLVLIPAFFAWLFACLGKLGIHSDGEYILMVVLLAACAPPATMITQAAQTYGGEAKYASILNVMCVVFCIVTIPAMTMFYEVLL